jgi:hypothetical protein
MLLGLGGYLDCKKLTGDNDKLEIRGRVTPYIWLMDTSFL